ncbi:SE1832 family protein [Cytobacillus kochii]|uniref:SE1832 family protein n=1 Tax=Cytobacillus kochii TaxID=859143 RepID=UPI0025A15006|nr:SE1832 family protein [Cytobacillus kochii]MDM5207719.1 SE1832 family protein [Cytobacillus kochii]
MTLKEIENQLAELKMDYMRLQDDIEKLESFGRSVEKQELRMKEIEEELQSLNHLKAELEK